LNAVTARKMARPGKSTSTRALGSSTSWKPFAIRRPQEAVGSGAPKPRKLSALSRRMADPTPNVAATSAGERQLGSTCTSSVRSRELPSARLAST